jgi:small redox-active disulfide protein 2
VSVEIIVLGTGCARCKQLTALVEQVVKEIGGQGLSCEKVDDVKKIVSYGVLAVPGLVINGVVKSAGNLPRKEQLTAWIKEALKGKL